jgi:hypothetical protein
VGTYWLDSQGCGKRAEGLAYHDQVSAIADGLDHRVGVVVQPQRVVVCGKVGRHRAVSSCPQLGLDQVPVPADVAAPWIKAKVLTV